MSRHRADRPKVPEVEPLVRALYRRGGLGGVGCCLHVMLDYCNTDDETAHWCLIRARENGHADCIELAEKLALMSRTQRRRLALLAGP